MLHLDHLVAEGREKNGVPREKNNWLLHSGVRIPPGAVNPFNAETTFVQSTRTKKSLKII